jgi:hypothetical protein
MLTLEMINGNMVGGECRLGKNDVFVCLNTYVLNFRIVYIICLARQHADLYIVYKWCAISSK